MTVVIYIIMFIIGTIFGSFYNVVGYRIPKNESIIYPKSHCPNCNHNLKWYELIPIISYIMQKGKCKKCGKKISPFYLIFELITGILFMTSYIIFGFKPYLIIALTFISMLIIVTISDSLYMIIPDSVLLTFGLLLLIEIGIIYGPSKVLISILNGSISFIFMYLLKKFGNFIFKRESMGDGDIKLLFITGMILTFPIAVLGIFVGSVIGLPISIILVKKNSGHIIPFGPFLAAGAILLLLTKVDINTIINFYNYWYSKTIKSRFLKWICFFIIKNN